MDKKHTGLLISTCILSTVSLLLAFSIVFITLMYKNEIKELNNTISQKNEEINAKNEKLNAKNIEISNLNSKIDKYESSNVYDELNDYDKMFIRVISVPNDNSDYEHSSGTFFASHSCIITPEGKKYHKLNCQHIRNMNKYRIMNIKAAESYGYEKCSDCFD